MLVVKKKKARLMSKTRQRRDLPSCLMYLKHGIKTLSGSSRKKFFKKLLNGKVLGKINMALTQFNILEECKFKTYLMFPKIQGLVVRIFILINLEIFKKNGPGLCENELNELLGASTNVIIN